MIPPDASAPRPAPPRPSLVQKLTAQVARQTRREAALGRDLSDALARVRRASDLVEGVLENHAAYHVLAVDLAMRVRLALLPHVVGRTAVYPPGPPADPTRPDPLPGPPPE